MFRIFKRKPIAMKMINIEKKAPLKVFISSAPLPNIGLLK